MPNGTLLSWFREQGLKGEVQTSLFASVVAIILVWGLHALVQRFVIARIRNPTARFSARRVVRYVGLFAAVFVVGRIWYSGFQSVATIVGLLGAGVAIALKDPLTNLAGWIFLVVRHPFRIGDRIKVGEHTGDVVDVGLFQFQLHEVGAWVDADQPTGRVIFIPNAIVFTEPQLNFHRGLPYIWDEVTTDITFESDWQKGKELLEPIGCRHARPDPELDDESKRQAGETGYFLLGAQSKCEVYTSVKRNGVRLTLRYAVEPRERRRVRSAIYEDILKAIEADEHIELAYPTYRRVTLEPTPVLSADRVPRGGHSKDPA